MEGSYNGEHSSRLQELHLAATHLLSAPDEETVYSRVVETAERVLGFDYCSALVSDDGDFVVVASSHLEREVRFSGRGGILEETIQRGEGILTPDITPSDVANPANADYRSGVSVSLGDEAVLQAISKSPNHYDEDDLELAELLAVHADAALTQVRSEQLLREQNRKIEELHTVATELESCHTREELYTLMRRASEEILGFDWCTLYEIEDDQFVVAMASESSPMEVGEYPFPEGRSKARDIFESGGSHVVDDVSEIDEGEPTTDRIRSALQVAVGNVGVYNAAHERPGVFDESDLELAELLASSIAEAYERIEAQEQLRVQKRELERQNERLDRFASMVSHDLRNPLTVARLQAELIGADDERTETVIDALDRMEALVQDMLSLARAGRDVETVDVCQIANLAMPAWANVRTDESELDVRLENATLEANELRMIQLFENLFRNALDHNETAVTVRVGELEEGGFYVEDSGVGIPEDEREDVFTHGYTTSENGSGFGLAIVDSILDAHGWTSVVTESDDGGARLEIYTG